MGTVRAFTDINDAKAEVRKLRRENERLRAAVHKNGHERAKTDWEAKCRLLEQRDQERAREIMKVNARARAWQKQAEEERAKAASAEQNARQFHALLLQERVRKLGAPE